MLWLENVRAGYRDLPVLHGVSLRVEPGEIVAVIGSNAAGKTTLLKTVAGLLSPMAGSVVFDGAPIARLAPHEIVDRGLCLVPERRVFGDLSVLDNLLLGAYLQRARRRVHASVEEVFALFPILRERRAQQAASLSGGEQQMLCIGRALMTRPRLLMLDEPSTALSPVLVESIFRTLTELNRSGLTLLLVEQNVARTLAFAHRAYVLENGRIVLHGEGPSLLHNDRVREAYLGI